MDFSVTILGSGSAIPTARRKPTSQFIQCCNRNILIDCGEGTQIQMRSFGVKFQRLDFILISHLHGDHYFGLVGLLSSMHLLGRVKPIDIYGPKGLEEIIKIQIEAEGSRLAYDIKVHEMQKNSSGILFEDEKIIIDNFPLSHGIPTHGFIITEKEKERTLLVEKAKEDGVKFEYYHRLKKGENIQLTNGEVLDFENYTIPGGAEKKYAYCSDTKYDESIISFIKQVDLLYHEATFTNEFSDRAKATSHSTASDAANIAKKAQVGQLLLGHLSARYDSTKTHLEEAIPIFENSIIVEDGDVYQVD